MVSKTKSKNENLKEKSKSLFDHVNNILTSKDVNYYKNLSDSDKKTWSTYMINRFLSMNPDYIEVINDIQQYSDLPSEIVSRVYIEIFPRKKIYSKYIKNNNIEKYESDVITYIMKYFECSKKEAIEYINILTENEVYEIVRKFGAIINKK